MGNPKGSNAGNHGKKGRSGRKSMYEEKARAEELIKFFFDDGVTMEDLAKIKKKLETKKGRITGWEKMKMRAIVNSKGTELLAMFNKLFPDKVKNENTNTEKLVLDKHTQDLLEKYTKNKEKKKDTK